MPVSGIERTRSMASFLRADGGRARVAHSRVERTNERDDGKQGKRLEREGGRTVWPSGDRGRGREREGERERERERENLHLYTFKATAIRPSVHRVGRALDQLLGAVLSCATQARGRGRGTGDRVRHLLLLSRVGGSIHSAQAVRSRSRRGERE